MWFSPEAMSRFFKPECLFFSLQDHPDSVFITSAITPAINQATCLHHVSCSHTICQIYQEDDHKKNIYTCTLKINEKDFKASLLNCVCVCVCFSATLLAFLVELLKSSVAMQEQMLGGKGFLVIGYLLEKVSKGLHNEECVYVFSYKLFGE